MPIFQLDVSQLKAYSEQLDRAAGNAHRVMKDVLMEAANVVLPDVKAAWQPHSYTGASLNAMTIDSSRLDQYEVDVGLPQSVIPMHRGFPYPVAVELGQRPHFAPLQRIVEWAMFRGKVQFARAIWRAIARKGTRAYHVFGELVMSPILMDKLERAVSQVIGRLGI